MESVNVMNQVAGKTEGSDKPPQWCVPLEHVSQSAAGDVADAGVTIRDVSHCGLLVLRGDAAGGGLQQAASKVLSLTLPGPLQSAASEQLVLRWMTPNEWLLSCPFDEVFRLEQALRSATTGSAAFINVSGGYAVFELSGEHARSVLHKSTAYDVHPDHFPPGKVVNTTFAKTQATLRALESDRVELIVRRSYADYVWLWLQRAGREYRLAIVRD